MRRGYILTISFIICLVGSRYYFGLTILEGNYIKLYGLMCLIIAVLLGSSCLTYLPRKFSIRLDFYSLIILSIIQCIPILYIRGGVRDNPLLEIIELIIPSSIAIIGGTTVICLVIMMCKETLTLNKQMIKTNSKAIRRKKKIKAIKVKG